MCELNTLVEGSKKGWKVVVDIGGKYFSLAMGCEYPKDGPVPVVMDQHNLTLAYFYSDLLDQSRSAYKVEMIGRTAVFQDKDEAGRLVEDILSCGGSIGTTKVVPAEVSQDVMEGVYHIFGNQSVVFAGKHIKFLEE